MKVKRWTGADIGASIVSQSLISEFNEVFSATEQPQPCDTKRSAKYSKHRSLILTNFHSLNLRESVIRDRLQHLCTQSD